MPLVVATPVANTRMIAMMNHGVCAVCQAGIRTMKRVIFAVTSEERQREVGVGGAGNLGEG